MQALNYFKRTFLPIIFLIITALPNQSFSQNENIKNVLEQNISIFSENEPLTEVIKKICSQFDLDYAYNSKLIREKRVSLSVSNKTVGEVLNKLMKDFYLIFEIENNILMVRDYVPLSENIDYEYLYNSPASGFKLNHNKKKKITIDFQMISNLIVIPLQINGSDTMNFILDTGVKDPIITELTMIEELDLKYMKPIKIRGLGTEHKDFEAYQSGNNQISIPGLTASHQRINLILDEDFQISQILGLPVHGLIGFGLFKDYIMKINYRAEQITLYKPQFFKYRPQRKDIVMPLHFVRNKPLIRSEIADHNGETVPVMLLVDTGASDAVWLSPTVNEQIKIPEKNIYSYLGAGLGGDLYGYKARMGGIWLGGMALYDPIISYPESDFIDQIIKRDQRHGTIGGEVLRRFTVTFDYYNKRMILRPNSDYKDNFVCNMSGLEVINPVPGVSVFTISRVIENSPAAKAGLIPSDQIISINYKTHNELSLNDINLVLQKKNNKKVNLTVLRNGERIKTSFHLQDQL